MDATDTVKCFRNIPYTADNDEKHTLNLYVPVLDTATSQEFPLLLYVHGGAWRSGDKSEYEYLGEHLASRGIASAIISYRLSTRTTSSPRHPSHLLDCAQAIHWLRNESRDFLGYTPIRMYLMGHSAGGQLTGLLTLQPKWLEDLGGPELWGTIKGVIGVEGIYDIPRLVAVWPSYIDFIEMAFGTDQKTWVDASPQYHRLSGNYHKLPPYLIIHSPEDDLIEVAHAERYVDHLKTLGGEVSLDTHVRGKHFEMLREKVFFDAVLKFIEDVENSNLKPYKPT